MLRLKRYLKPFIWGIVFAVLMLGLQAYCDLNLPNYMSDIVNIGIQQNGVKNAAPDVISADGFTLLGIFMTPDEKALMNSNYRQFAAADTNSHGQTFDTVYPKLNGRAIFLRNEGISKDTMDQLNLAVGAATWTMINTMRALAEQQAAAGGSPAGGTPSIGSGSLTDMGNFDITQVYGMLPMLSQLPQPMIDAARGKALANDSTILTQSGSVLTRLFYTELGMDMTGYQVNYIIQVGLMMLLMVLLNGIATVLVSLMSSRISAGVARNLRSDIFAKVEHFSNAEFDKLSTASLITRSTNDVTQIQMLVMMGIRFMCYAPILGVGGVFMALSKSISMSWTIATAVIVLLGIVSVAFTVVIPKFKIMQKLIDRLNLVARETLSGLMVIRAFGTSRFEKDRFDKANRDLARTNLFITRTMALMMPTMMFLMNLFTIGIIWIGAHHVANSTMRVGDMMAFMQYAILIVMSFFMISMAFIFIPRASVSAGRIAGVLETEPSIVDPASPRHMEENRRGYVEFKNVSFKHEGADEYALKNITLTAKPGQTVAFIGATGSGKSTLVNLIPRFYDTTEGDILVGGVNVKDVTQKELRSRIGYVPQKAVLMSGTIESNIKYGNDSLTVAELVTVSKVAQAYDFISEKEDTFEADISQGGGNVSGGQRQRLAIARALAMNPDIYIFDDSFSALDFKTDAALRAALKEHTGGSTVLIVAQRISTIMKADQIYFLQEGGILAHGTHRELLQTCPAYYEIASSQLSKEELDHA